MIASGTFPCNEWSSSGDLLLDPNVEASSVLDYLGSGLAALPLEMLWLDEILPGAERWEMFRRALARRGEVAVVRTRWSVGRVPIQGDWAAYRSSWSRKHRQHMGRCIRQLLHRGSLEVRLFSGTDPEEAVASMRRGLELEDRGWKGAAGTSVIRTPGMEAFFLRQAELLARQGQLELAFLESAGQPIAFTYGQTAKGVFHSAKIGYDRSMAAYSPGQVLRYFLLERFFHEGGRKALDFLGPLTPSHASWRPETYEIARLATSLGHRLGKLAVSAYSQWW